MTRLALIAASGIVLTGCGSSHVSSLPPAHHSSYPFAILLPRVFPTNLRFAAPRFISPTRLAITTWGSSSCPNVPAKIVVQSPHAIELRLAAGMRTHGKLVAYGPPRGCTMDLGPTAMLLTVDPTRIDVHHPVTIRGLFYPPFRSNKPQVWTAPALKR